MNFFIGQICMFPWSWAPRGWLRCDGQTLNIGEYTALYSLVGMEFGGDGKTTFNLPKMTPIKAEGAGDVSYYVCVEGVYPSRH